MILALIGRHALDLVGGGMVLVMAAFVAAAVVEHRNSSR